MSASQCIKCEQVVPMYEKYCEICVQTYGVKQDADYWKLHGFEAWQNRDAEFTKDLESAVHTTPNLPIPKIAARHLIPPPVYVGYRVKPNKQSTAGYMKRFGSRPQN
jgi:hypothetical protein